MPLDMEGVMRRMVFRIVMSFVRLDGFLLESATILKNTYTLFVRAESVAQTELHVRLLMVPAKSP